MVDSVPQNIGLNVELSCRKKVRVKKSSLHNRVMVNR